MRPSNLLPLTLFSLTACGGPSGPGTVSNGGSSGSSGTGAMHVLPTRPPEPDASKPLVLYGKDHGITEPITDASPDELGNIWAVSDNALYVRRPGGATFRRYTNADGLHIASRVTAVAGGAANEGYVGLLGWEDDNPFDDTDAQKRIGKAEHVTLHDDGTISSVHYAELHNDDSANYWETRSARRLLYVHTGEAAGHLFMGGNHGVTHILDDGWGDHVHVEAIDPTGSLLVGEWYGLAIDPATGGLWTCGRYACGLQPWNADPHAWVQGAFTYAFTVQLASHDLNVPTADYHEDHVAVAVADKRVYFLSQTHGLASWDPQTGNYMTIRKETVPGLGMAVDMVADTDGSLLIADQTTLHRWKPGQTKDETVDVGSMDLHRLYLDATVTPRALYVATGDGVAVYRGQ